MRSRRLKFLVILTCFLSVLPSIGRSQKYPDKPMRLVVPYAAGGGTDILARSLSAKVSDVLGQTIVVDNKAGAGGNIGADFVAKASPDGYTLLMAANTIPINAALQKLPFDPVNDFAAISMVGSAGQVLVVHPSVPATTIAELTAFAKANPNKLNFGSGGKGIQSHISGEMYKSAVGVNIVHIPYKGTIQAVTNLLAGQIQMVFSDMVPAMPHIKSGKLRAIAVTSLQRSAALPDVPTMSESGLSGFDSGVWWSIVAPKGTPIEIINRINSELGKMMQFPDVRETYARVGVTTQHSTPSKVVETIRAESPTMAKILREAGVEAE